MNFNQPMVYLVGFLILVGILYYFFYYQENFSPASSNITLENQVEETKPSGKTKVYNFNTSWCGYSVMFAPEWAKFESKVSGMENVEAIDVKCDDENNQKICQEFEVPGFPTVIFEKNGQRQEYQGARSADALVEYLQRF